MIVAERKCLGMLKIPAKNVIILIESKVVKITGHSRSHSLVLNTQEGNYFCLRKDNDSSTTEPNERVHLWQWPNESSQKRTKPTASGGVTRRGRFLTKDSIITIRRTLMIMTMLTRRLQLLGEPSAG